jgi:hypothetical protein
MTRKLSLRSPVGGSLSPIPERLLALSVVGGAAGFEGPHPLPFPPIPPRPLPFPPQPQVPSPFPPQPMPRFR